MRHDEREGGCFLAMVLVIVLSVLVADAMTEPDQILLQTTASTASCFALVIASSSDLQQVRFCAPSSSYVQHPFTLLAKKKANLLWLRLDLPSNVCFGSLTLLSKVFGPTRAFHLDSAKVRDVLAPSTWTKCNITATAGAGIAFEANMTILIDRMYLNNGSMNGLTILPTPLATPSR
ncbi:hypothetical protein SDRG_11804 [Saprolegnia diclina VS20]|uniref:Uncharacterized protein n=1 Tax=Saprolegnia diclina (strain VS20) TaxID=1156394 RepID=T0RKT2_SAPDV|nr:hypothetical protein SDRG_11803 [Saprolegnia diclina VS20]XP_008616081.1 hypothetical protein SDRG_11804 [Saprolegnia diclina VS20]EQC30487.1 hypothetical protein SDRG_11803 [Saprolegnia diclina VS20]EQC30488.1 hypothetical protein SDRG_11804 [Saprolegnia diclina VS20]|eukprot:XP_008616080.1 hypothetical protein SDRG_11803 [Saprolegnia diclina VS20]